jgi:opacity protein-like surface antigen
MRINHCQESVCSKSFTSAATREGLAGLSLCVSVIAAMLFAPVSDKCRAQATDTTQATSDWSFDVVPYLWLASFDGNGTFGVAGVPPGTSVDSHSKFETRISAAAMLMGQIRYREFGLLLDGAWAQLKTEGTDLSAGFSTVDIKTDIAYGTAALSYRLPQCCEKLNADVYAGARIWHVKNELDFQSGLAPVISVEGSRTFYDPVLGAKLRYDFCPHWYAVVMGDAGGFGAGADLEWNAFGGIGYQFTETFSATVGYRYMHVDYSKDAFKIDANVQGFLLGLGFHF